CRQHLCPDLAHYVAAFVAGAVGWWRGGLEDDVVGNEGRDGIKGMGVEGSGEAFNEIEDGIVSVHAAILPAAAESRSGHAVRHCGYSGSVADTGRGLPAARRRAGPAAGTGRRAGVPGGTDRVPR